MREPKLGSISPLVLAQNLNEVKNSKTEALFKARNKDLLRFCDSQRFPHSSGNVSEGEVFLLSKPAVTICLDQGDAPEVSQFLMQLGFNRSTTSDHVFQVLCLHYLLKRENNVHKIYSMLLFWGLHTFWLCFRNRCGSALVFFWSQKPTSPPK